MTKKFRFMTGLLAVVLAFVMLSSVAFIAAEAGHDCTGADCAICHQIHVCENLLKSIDFSRLRRSRRSGDSICSVPDPFLLHGGCPRLYAGIAQGQTFGLKYKNFYKGGVYLFSIGFWRRCRCPLVFLRPFYVLIMIWRSIYP